MTPTSSRRSQYCRAERDADLPGCGMDSSCLAWYTWSAPPVVEETPNLGPFLYRWSLSLEDSSRYFGRALTLPAFVDGLLQLSESLRRSIGLPFLEAAHTMRGGRDCQDWLLDDLESALCRAADLNVTKWIEVHRSAEKDSPSDQFSNLDPVSGGSAYNDGLPDRPSDADALLDCHLAEDVQLQDVMHEDESLSEARSTSYAGPGANESYLSSEDSDLYDGDMAHHPSHLLITGEMGGFPTLDYGSDVDCYENPTGIIDKLAPVASPRLGLSTSSAPLGPEGQQVPSHGVVLNPHDHLLRRLDDSPLARVLPLFRPNDGLDIYVASARAIWVDGHGVFLSPGLNVCDHHRQLLFPVYHMSADHWNLGVIDRDSHKCAVYDSSGDRGMATVTAVALQQTAGRLNIRENLEQDVDPCPSLRQGVRDGSVVFTIAWAAHLVNGLPMNSIDITAWHGYLSTLAYHDDSADKGASLQLDEYPPSAAEEQGQVDIASATRELASMVAWEATAASKLRALRVLYATLVQQHQNFERVWHLRYSLTAVLTWCEDMPDNVNEALQQAVRDQSAAVRGELEATSWWSRISAVQLEQLCTRVDTDIKSREQRIASIHGRLSSLARATRRQYEEIGLTLAQLLEQRD